MNDTRWARIDDLFARVADLAPAERRAALEQWCGDDRDLADEVLSLLAHDGTGGQQIAALVQAAARLPVPDAACFTGQRIGPYLVVRELGRGGMGVVFEAVRDDGVFTKRVALKVAARAAYAPEFLQRFQHERQVLARLEHPSIAQLLDGGATADGVPYFVMELIEGVPLNEHIARHEPEIRERLRLFLQVCDAVDYAHQNLVIHRDLTPRNILVAAGSVKLLDFGIAKLIDPGRADATSPGLALFTPAYCSPEQLLGAPVTTRTDVYALGLILFETLTGQRAQQVGDGTSPTALDRAICQTPVAAPSTTVAARGDRRAARRMRGDLDTIVGVATEKEPSRRYPSVSALADDVRRHLDSRPILARPPGVWYTGTRLARRHWGPLTAAVLLVIALAAGIVTTRAEARRAERRFEEVRRIANALMTDVHAAIRDLPASTAAQDVVVKTAVEYLEGLQRESGDDPALLSEVGRGYTKVAELAYSMSRPSLGRPDEAREYLDRARGILTPLQAADPADPHVAVAMSHLHSVTGSFLRDTGRNNEALAEMETAVSVSEAALARHPDDVELLQGLVSAYDSLIASYDTHPAVLPYLPRYIERAEQLVRLNPGDGASQSGLGVAYSQAGKAAHAAGRVDEALAYFRRNSELQAAVVATEPFNTTARRNLMLAWSNVGDVALGPLGLSSYTGSGGPAVEIDEGHRRQALEASARTIEQGRWIRDQDPQDVTAAFDYAVALGRSAPAYPPGDDRAIAAIDEALGILRGLEAQHPARTRVYLTEFYGSLAERQRQSGRLDRAREAWADVDAVLRRALAASPDAFYPRRQVIPILQNQAMALARAGDVAAARLAAERAVTLADEVGARAADYARAPGWPPRVRGWLAEFETSLGDLNAARAARSESLALWTPLAERTDLPVDVVDEAKAALASTSR